MNAHAISWVALLILFFTAVAAAIGVVLWIFVRRQSPRGFDVQPLDRREAK
jgi:hypothetical protein